jgi:hypothetical protein
MTRVPVLLAVLATCALWIARATPDTAGSPTEPGTLSPPSVTAPAEAREVARMEDLADAALHGGRWYLLDARRRRVHLVDDEAERSFPVGTAEGGRPQVLVAHHDTLVVLERTGGTVHLYDAEGARLARRRLSIPGCGGLGFFDAVSTPRGLVVLAVCPGRRLNTRAFAVLEAHGGVPRILAATAARPAPDLPVDPLFTPVLAEHPDGIVFGSAQDPCLAVIDFGGVAVDSVCHRWMERFPLPPEEAAALSRARIAATALGARLATTERLPPFDRIFAVGPGWYAYRAPTPEGGPARRLIQPRRHRTDDVPLPPARRVFGGPGEALLAWVDAGTVRITRHALAR